MAYKYRGKYPKRVAHVSFSKARGWRVRLNDGTIHNPPSRVVVAAFPIDGIKLGMEWADVETAMIEAGKPSRKSRATLAIIATLGTMAAMATYASTNATQGASDTFSINDSISTDCHLVTITTMDNRDTLSNALALASDTIRQTGCVNIEVQQ